MGLFLDHADLACIGLAALARAPCHCNSYLLTNHLPNNTRDGRLFGLVMVLVSLLTCLRQHYAITNG